MNFPEIPGFEIIEKFSRGGMSYVYKARQISLDRVVVIKTLPPSQNSQYSDVKQFMFEARIAANLKHPNIVQVYDFGRREDLYYFVMEYVSGYSVAEWIHRKDKISEQDSLILVETVAKALEHAWSKARVVHCDIKPDNIMIDSDGTVKVADLGLAKSVRSMARNTGKTEGELVTGTPNYISPEQSRGDSDIDFRADMYSMGAMLYHMLTGVMPFQNLDAIEAMDAQIASQLEDPQDINPLISTPAAYFIEKLMAKKKEDRYADWSGVIADIAKVSAKQMPLFLSEKVSSTVKRGERRKHNRPSPNILSDSLQKAKKEEPLAKSSKSLKSWNVLIKTPGRTAIMLGGALIAAVMLTVGLVLITFRSDPVREPTLVAGEQLVQEQPPGPDQETKRREEEAARKREEAERRIEMESRGKEAQDEYQRALTWWNSNPGKYAQAIRNFQQVAQTTAGSEYSDLAREQSRKIEVARRDAADAIVASLKKQAEQFVSEEKYLQAVALYKDYDGALAFETADTRNFLAETIEQQHMQRVQKRKKETEKARKFLDDLKAEVARKCLEADVQSAKTLVEHARNNSIAVFNKQAIDELYDILSEASGTREKIVKSFKKQIGTEIRIALKSGTQAYSINEVYEDRIEAERIVRTESGELRAKASFSLDDLAIEEKMARHGQVNTAGMALARAVMILEESHDINAAEKYFAETGRHLKPVFEEQIGQMKADKLNAEAQNYLGRLCKHLDIKPDIGNPDSVFAALKARQYSASEAAMCKKFVAMIEAKYSETDFIRRYERVIRLLSTFETHRGYAH